MSSALKRRFNFETVKPISDRAFEVQLVQHQLHHELQHLIHDIEINPNVLELLITVFQELRTGKTEQGATLKTPAAVMSTAEAVNIAHAACLQAIFLDNGKLSAAHIAQQLLGVVFKDHADDAKRLRYYLDTVVKERTKQDADWKAFYEASRVL